MSINNKELVDNYFKTTAITKSFKTSLALFSDNESSARRLLISVNMTGIAKCTQPGATSTYKLFDFTDLDLTKVSKKQIEEVIATWGDDFGFEDMVKGIISAKAHSNRHNNGS